MATPPVHLAAPESKNLASPVGALMRPTARVAPEDTLERAAAEMRRNGVGILPVAQDDFLRGIVSTTSLAVAMAEGTPLTAAVDTAMVRPETIAPYATGAEALRRLAEGDGHPLVVVDDAGRLMGLISTVDLYPFPRQLVRPPMIGGMATPFGVYLTTGSVTAGARWWALVATGASMMCFLLVGDWIAAAFVQYALRLNPGTTSATVTEGVIAIFLFFLLMRLFPLSGTHGAEHQVVHAIERGEPLTPEVVRRMPRVHPRCGTNLAAGASIFLGTFALPWPFGPEYRLFVAAIAMYILWRPIGSLLQKYVTTRRPSDRQLAGGIRAGEELLARHVAAEHSVASLGRRLWNSGLAYVIAGSCLVAGVIELIDRLFNLQL